MKMTRIEKHFVNSERKTRQNIERITRQLSKLGKAAITDVLEIGCGIGSVADFLSDTNHMNVWGVDIDPGQVELAGKHYPENERLHYKVENATKLSFNPGSFDLVISQHVFHHIPNWEQAVSEISRVLRPGGYLIWLDLVIPGFLKIIAPLFKDYGAYTLDDVRKALDDNQLTELFHEKFFQGGMTNYQLIMQKAI